MYRTKPKKAHRKKEEKNFFFAKLDKLWVINCFEISDLKPTEFLIANSLLPLRTGLENKQTYILNNL